MQEPLITIDLNTDLVMLNGDVKVKVIEGNEYSYHSLRALMVGLGCSNYNDRSMFTQQFIAHASKCAEQMMN